MLKIALPFLLFGTISCFAIGGTDSPAVSPTEMVEMQTEETTANTLPYYKEAAEKHLSTLYDEELNFDSWANYRQWEAGNLVYVENYFTIAEDETRHKYLIRVGGEQIFYIKIDDECVYWDEENETNFLDQAE